MNVGYGAITSQMFLFFVLVYEGIPYSVFTWTFTNSKQGLGKGAKNQNGNF